MQGGLPSRANFLVIFLPDLRHAKITCSAYCENIYTTLNLRVQTTFFRKFTKTLERFNWFGLEQLQSEPDAVLKEEEFARENLSESLENTLMEIADEWKLSLYLEKEKSTKPTKPTLSNNLLNMLPSQT